MVDNQETVVLGGLFRYQQLSSERKELLIFVTPQIISTYEKNLTNIYLIGPMGAGKTSVGSQLAKLTKRILYDSDKEIEKRTGADIAWIFKMEGEDWFPPT